MSDVLTAKEIDRRNRLDKRGIPYCDECGRSDKVDGWLVLAIYREDLRFEDYVAFGTKDDERDDAFCSWECAAVYARKCADVV